MRDLTLRIRFPTTSMMVFEVVNSELVRSSVLLIAKPNFTAFSMRDYQTWNCLDEQFEDVRYHNVTVGEIIHEH